MREGKLTVTGGLTCDGFPRPAIGKIPYAIWILARDVVRRSKFNKRSDRIAGNLTQQASGGMVPGQLRNHGEASQCARLHTQAVPHAAPVASPDPAPHEALRQNRPL